MRPSATDPVVQAGAPRAATAARVLVIEDEAETAEHMREALAAAGCVPDLAHDGPTGLERALAEPYDVLIVDRMLPGLDGLSLVGRLRDAGVHTPILFVTAMGAVADRVEGLQGGGDDYLVKPFSFAELNARVAALARRSPTPPRERTVLQCADLALDRLERTAERGGQAISLLPLEYKLLEYLMLHAGQIVTRAMLLEKVWGFHFDPRTNIVETHLSRLRAKVDPPGAPPLIATVRGAGYVIRPPA
ncbi:response regulator transcription factor [uncultured Caulobacter sp.]|uniref:response regulator transcription factor n=1 Tax=uncultured Caulobacter sp. TaxID=158749 RepID=UPI002629FAC7|nr:response regulator transcription factor [uncultured Caulobacter sp.]